MDKLRQFCLWAGAISVLLGDILLIQGPLLVQIAEWVTPVLQGKRRCAPAAPVEGIRGFLLRRTAIRVRLGFTALWQHQRAPGALLGSSQISLWRMFHVPIAHLERFLTPMTCSLVPPSVMLAKLEIFRILQ